MCWAQADQQWLTYDGNSSWGLHSQVESELKTSHPALTGQNPPGGKQQELLGLCSYIWQWWGQGRRQMFRHLFWARGHCSESRTLAEATHTWEAGGQYRGKQGERNIHSVKRHLHGYSHLDVTEYSHSVPPHHIRSGSGVVGLLGGIPWHRAQSQRGLARATVEMPAPASRLGLYSMLRWVLA